MAETPILRNVSPKKRGDTWYFAFRIIDVDNTDPDNPIRTPRNMTGATAKLVVRASKSNTATKLVTGTLVSSPTDLTNGLIILRCDQTNTAVSPDDDSNPPWYDAEIEHNGDRTTWYHGQWPIVDEVALAAD